jgi:hypothetical protein
LFGIDTRKRIVKGCAADVERVLRQPGKGPSLRLVGMLICCWLRKTIISAFHCVGTAAGIPDEIQRVKVWVLGVHALAQSQR